jgi:hypothetical protein
VETDSDSECGDKFFIRSPIAESQESAETSLSLGARNRFMTESIDQKWLWNLKLLGYISRHLNCFNVNIDTFLVCLVLSGLLK